MGRLYSARHTARPLVSMLRTCLESSRASHSSLRAGSRTTAPAAHDVHHACMPRNVHTDAFDGRANRTYLRPPISRCSLPPLGPPLTLSNNTTQHTPSLSVSVCLCRIKYILRQSDIFATHFGVVLSDSEDEEEEKAQKEEEDNSKGAAAAGGSPSKRRQAGRGAAADEMVDDVSGESTAPTFLTKQPPSISGGTLRSYQLEGLNWMVNLQAQGTNGKSYMKSCLRRHPRA